MNWLPSLMHKALKAIKTGVLSGLPAWGTPASTLRAREGGMQYPTQPGPTPHTVRWRCENCAQPLAVAYTVCAHCEPGFSAPWDNRWRAPERAQQPALHTCAQCGFGFDVASVRLQPDPAPWWRMQTMAHCCPACRGRLDWIPSAQAHPAEVWSSFSVWGLVSMQWGIQVLGMVRGARPHRGGGLRCRFSWAWWPCYGVLCSSTNRRPRRILRHGVPR